MKITYIYHSSFLTETKNFYLLFDYFKGQIPDLNADKPLVVFASHRHADHFSEKIFELEKQHKNIWFVLSADIWRKRVPQPLQERTLFIGSGKQETFAGLQVETLKSTDEGVAFLIRTDEGFVYHAGDLNDWAWTGESERFNQTMRKAYRRQIEKLAEKEIKAAFVVLDPRQGTEFAAGMTWFLQHVQAEEVFPMHCWDDYSVISKYKKLEEAKPYAAKIKNIKEPGEIFTVL